MWLKKLTIAIVEKDVKNISKLMDNLPQLTKVEEIDSALSLLNEANNLMVDLREETSNSMIQMKKNINFLDATNVQISHQLDITS